MPNPKTFDYLQFWTRNNVALNVPVLDHTGLKKKKKRQLPVQKIHGRHVPFQRQHTLFPNLGGQSNC